MNTEIEQLTKQINELEFQRLKLTTEVEDVCNWLQYNQQNMNRHEKTRQKTATVEKLRFMNLELKKLMHARSIKEHEYMSKIKTDGIKASRTEKDLLFQCNVVLSGMEQRGISFDVRERVVARKLKDYILQM